MIRADRKVCAVVALAALVVPLGGAVCAGADAAPPDDTLYTELSVTVVNGDGAGVKGAEVFVKSQTIGTSFEEIKMTKANGSTRFKRVPRGSVKIQVTCVEWKTFGEQYLLDEAQEARTVTLVKDATEAPPTNH